jgi:integrase
MARMQSFSTFEDAGHDELKTFIRAIRDGYKMSARRYRLLVLVGYWHALRITELLRLTPENFAGSFLSVKRLKGSDDTVHRLQRPDDPELQYADELMTLVKTLAPRERLFPITRFGAWDFFQSTGERAGVNPTTGEALVPPQKRHPHVLKHTLCQRAVPEAGIENVRVYVGHKTISSTGEYMKVPEEKAWKAIAAAVGK